ncbi:hypothetical protein ACKKBF_B39990 [Auxenochlorella protothecoides x Auxenochlorella symbiontica]
MAGRTDPAPIMCAPPLILRIHCRRCGHHVYRPRMLCMMHRPAPVSPGKDWVPGAPALAAHLWQQASPPLGPPWSPSLNSQYADEASTAAPGMGGCWLSPHPHLAPCLPMNHACHPTISPPSPPSPTPTHTPHPLPPPPRLQSQQPQGPPWPSVATPRPLAGMAKLRKSAPGRPLPPYEAPLLLGPGWRGMNHPGP